MFPKAEYPLTADQLENAAKTRFKTTVITCGTDVAAYANLYDLDGDSCWLGNVIVSPIYRGQGAAGYLIEVMTSIVKNEFNVRTLKLVCHNTNTRALLFFMKQGFKPFDITIRTKPAGEYIAGIHITKTLATGGALDGNNQ